MQVTISEPWESAVRNAVDAGRFDSPTALIQEALREMFLADETLDAHYARLAQDVLEEDTYFAPGPGWREEIRALVNQRRGT